jgi:DNA-3-methyladenine glycosylase II
MPYTCKMMPVELPYKDIKSKLISLDNVLEQVMHATPTEIQPLPSVDIYRNLLQSIVSQQLSTKVAKVIWERFVNLFPDEDVNPKAVIDMEFTQLRGVGLSGSKSNYIQNVAHFALENDMSLESLMNRSDEEIIEYLTAIKGVGKWTVQMILMFPLDRPNVFPVDDLGIQIKMKHWYGLKSEKKELKLDMERVADKWKPYRSLACKYLWSSHIPKK